LVVQVSLRSVERLPKPPVIRTSTAFELRGARWCILNLARIKEKLMEYPICITCGTQYGTPGDPPSSCTICEDDRQYVNANGQQWTTLGEMQQHYTNTVTEITSGLTAIRTTPNFAIGQQAHLIQTENGNVLWDCISLVDDGTIEHVQKLGGIQAITISHPHFYSSMVEWSRVFDAPIYLHAGNRPWVMRPDSTIHFWEGETHELLPGVTLIRCGGHFPGSSVLHWSEGAAGKGALFTGDTIYVVSDQRYVSFMYSYPNLIPLNAAAVRRIAATVAPYSFDRLYAAWDGKIVEHDAHAAVQRSAERYVDHIQG
jgi:glyoxylase-like metal-dependent hydrolase (beta-lactamase superfamily II)